MIKMSLLTKHISEKVLLSVENEIWYSSLRALKIILLSKGVTDLEMGLCVGFSIFIALSDLKEYPEGRSNLADS